ncbi:hypothetical protein P0F20_000386 [Vibrio metschnikovii]|uniref:hypothetical protein n=1 Tax=Vibrio injensis TaxID=1307414 RepID=UPI00278BFAF7|nr:hypothetical protein [Vibrio injensis]EKO3578631.1 hypothetical protein [Vibrio metschnikovii]EKO3771884.1 hypothetical protein [Vibrio metschnikovii]
MTESSFVNAKVLWALPPQSGQISFLIETEQGELHHFMTSLHCAKVIANEVSHIEVQYLIERMRFVTENTRRACCPLRYPLVDWLPQDKQLHPEYRKGGVDACDSLLRFITKIEREIAEHKALIPRPTQYKPQPPLEDQGYKENRDPQNLDPL